MTPDAADQANQQMVDRLIAQGALWSPALTAAFRATPRHRFLDRVYQYQRKQERWREVLRRADPQDRLRVLYADRALITHLSAGGESGVPISSSSQPSLMAQMLQDLKLRRGLHVLEIGAGTGYNAALLSHVVDPGRVTSIDVDRRVLAEAGAHLGPLLDHNVSLKHADGRYGWADGAPYDRIMVTAATPDLEAAWLEQLTPGGLLLAPLALAPGLAFVVRGRVADGTFHGRLVRAAYFMPLRAEGEAGSSANAPLPRLGPLKTLPAPWASWFERRRPRLGWLGFSQALAFYALLRRYTLHYQTLQDGPAFGISDEERNCLCWLGLHDWHVSGEAGRDLGWSLWQAFLAAGGPWPTEFRLRARPDDQLRPGKASESYIRQGQCCRQVWELSEPRDRPGWI